MQLLINLNFDRFSGGKKKEVKKETGLGLTYKKAENFGEWYSEVSDYCGYVRLMYIQ